MDERQLQAQVRQTGFCSRPIRLRGHTDGLDVTTGELARIVDSEGMPGGALLIACGNRRATACPSCSRTYGGDAWHLIAAGIRGGKGIGPEVATHPRLFLTLTAPSFGPVHSSRMRHGRARPCRRRQGKCPHGALRCTIRHRPDDELLGQPLCIECFDYRSAVLWNARSSMLWDRTLIALRRNLAARVGVPASRFRDVATLSYVKVVEYQARGLVHFHAVLRLDGPQERIHEHPTIDTRAFAATVQRSVLEAVLPSTRDELAMRWGAQADIRPLTSPDEKRSASIAAYVAKYATKSVDEGGALDRRIRRRSDIELLAVNAHLRLLVRTCWDLGGHPAWASLRLRHWAHTLGYRGHWTTKSRNYSTTFASLRNARRNHRAERDVEPAAPRLGEWTFAGRGYVLDDSGDQQ
jgi:hypothetical protein